MKKIFKRVIIAFSLYSRIPMPHFIWEDEDAGHAAAFLPWIGLVIGLLEYAAYLSAKVLKLPDLAVIALLTLVPLVITGGFHLDGFMDVEDALLSWQGKEERLRILKDPHIGAFAVIRLFILAAVWVLALSLLAEGTIRTLLIFCLSFWQLRACAGLLSFLLPHAKRDGMLNMETGGKNRGDIFFLALELAAGMAAMGMVDIRMALILAGMEALHIFFYRKKMMQAFGGVTGDTIGFYLVRAETAWALLTGIMAQMQHVF